MREALKLSEARTRRRHVVGALPRILGKAIKVNRVGKRWVEHWDNAGKGDMPPARK